MPGLLPYSGGWLCSRRWLNNRLRGRFCRRLRCRYWRRGDRLCPLCGSRRGSCCLGCSRGSRSGRLRRRGGFGGGCGWFFAVIVVSVRCRLCISHRLRLIQGIQLFAAMRGTGKVGCFEPADFGVGAVRSCRHSGICAVPHIQAVIAPWEIL